MFFKNANAMNMGLRIKHVMRMENVLVKTAMKETNVINVVLILHHSLIVINVVKDIMVKNAKV